LEVLRSLSRNEPLLWDGKPNDERIRAAIDRALTGHGSLVMLGGGPGAGKTRLAMEMAEYASRVGFNCAVGHCYERE
jgi:transcriptional regulator with AAA-type ATPase domain